MRGYEGGGDNAEGEGGGPRLVVVGMGVLGCTRSLSRHSCRKRRRERGQEWFQENVGIKQAEGQSSADVTAEVP